MIAWTLELRATQSVRIDPGMVVGKIAWWQMQGRPSIYQGRYVGCRTVQRSLFAADAPAPDRAAPIRPAPPGHARRSDDR